MAKRIIPQLKKNLGVRDYRILVKHAQYFMNQEKKRGIGGKGRKKEWEGIWRGD